MLGVEDDARYEAAETAYRAAASQPNAAVDLVLQAEYKIGRCLQKQNRPDDAVDQFYRGVVVRYLEERTRNSTLGEPARIWFGRAARDAADLLEERGEWRKVVSLLERAVSAGAPDEAGLQTRIATIRSQHWWLFY